MAETGEVRDDATVILTGGLLLGGTGVLLVPFELGALLAIPCLAGSLYIAVSHVVLPLALWTRSLIGRLVASIRSVRQMRRAFVEQLLGTVDA